MILLTLGSVKKDFHYRRLCELVDSSKPYMED